MSKSNITKTDIMFEKIKDLIEKLPELIARQLNELRITTPKLDTSNIEIIIKEALKNSQNKEVDRVQGNTEVLDKLEELKEALQNKKPESQKVTHRISIDIASSKTFLSIMVIGVIILVSSFFIYQQQGTIKSLSDNDLKYRYIKAYNQIDSISIVLLEDIFEYNRKPELIRKLRKDVEQFERNVVERAERLEEARLKEKKAEALQQEAVKLKE
mgnify:FL=1